MDYVASLWRNLRLSQTLTGRTRFYLASAALLLLVLGLTLGGNLQAGMAEGPPQSDSAPDATPAPPPQEPPTPQGPSTPAPSPNPTPGPGPGTAPPPPDQSPEPAPPPTTPPRDPIELPPYIQVLTGPITSNVPIVRRDAAVMGFYTDPEPGLPGSYDTAVRQSEQLSMVCPFWYRVGFAGDGSVEPYGPGYDPAAAAQITSELQARGMKVLALVHNMRLGANVDTREIFHGILNDPAKQAALVDNLVAMVEDGGYDGINLDTEFLYPKDRAVFTEFVAALSAELRGRGHLVTAALPSKTRDDPANGWSGGFDLAALAPHLDWVAVMTYDEHGYVSTAGPIASIDWVRAVMDYITSVVPREKVLLGLAGHVFDWRAEHNKPRYISYARAIATADAHDVPIYWDNRYKSPFYDYTDPDTGEDRQVWFENRWSYAFKLDLVSEYGLGGVCLWRLGLEDPGLWVEIERRFTVLP